MRSPRSLPLKPEHHSSKRRSACSISGKRERRLSQTVSSTKDVIVVVRFQGPKANGMPTAQADTGAERTCKARGLKWRGHDGAVCPCASGKVLSAIHVCPKRWTRTECARFQGPCIVRVDCPRRAAWTVLTPGAMERPVTTADLSGNEYGRGASCLPLFRNTVGTPIPGARSICEPDQRNEPIDPARRQRRLPMPSVKRAPIVPVLVGDACCRPHPLAKRWVAAVCPR